MVPDGGDPAVLQPLTDLFHGRPGGAVDDAAAAGALRQQPQQRGGLVPGRLNVEVEVGAVKARDDHRRVAELQQRRDVLPDLLSGRGRKGGQHRVGGERCRKVGDQQIAGAEVLPPLGDAVRLIHGQQGHRLSAQLPEEALLLQPLRRHVEQLVLPGPESGQDGAVLLEVHGAVETGCRQAGGAQRGNLILHQRDQR